MIASVLCIYLPGIGHGFVQDDFSWIVHARGEVLEGIGRAFTMSLGFFRPVVTTSFTLNERLFGLEPFGYGLTNLLLAIACVVSIERLGRVLGLPAAYALLAAAVWIFNFHGINMAVLWISGRTSLLSTLFAVLAASAFERRRTPTATVWTMLALLSKEEAVLLPFIFTAWRSLENIGGSKDPPLRVKRTVSAKDPPLRVEGTVSATVRRGGSLDPPGLVRAVWPLFAMLGIYFALRARTDAFTPFNAPDYYQLTADPSRIVRNFIEYVDRSATTAGLVLLAVMAIARGLPRLERAQRLIAMKGAIWWLGAFAITMWLPIRSSLYAVFPSVGVTLIVAALASSIVPALSHERRRMLVATGLIAPFLLLPVYWSRNQRWVELADLSSATLAHVRATMPTLPERAVIQLIDDLERRDNFTNSFAGLLPEASQLFLERGIELRIDAAIEPSRMTHPIRLADVSP